MATVRSKIDIGSCKVLWTSDGGTEVELGLTAEGVVIDITETDADVRADEVTAPLMSVVDEGEVTADIELIEHTLDNIAIALRSTKTTIAGPPEKVGVNLSPIRGREVPFGKLTFHPRRLEDTDKSKDVTVWMALLRCKAKRIFQATTRGTVVFSFTAGASQDDATGKWFPLYTEGDPEAVEMFDLV